MIYVTSIETSGLLLTINLVADGRCQRIVRVDFFLSDRHTGQDGNFNTRRFRPVAFALSFEIRFFRYAVRRQRFSIITFSEILQWALSHKDFPACDRLR